MNGDESNRISLSRDDVAQAFKSAQEEAEHHSGRRKFPGDNSVTSHMVGKLGELAVASWLEFEHGCDVDRVFLDAARRHECDVAVRRPGTQLRIDVKSWQERTFNRKAGYVYAKQIPYIDKSDVLLWAQTSDLPEEIELEPFDSVVLNAVVVSLIGWSYTAELLTIGKVQWESSSTFGREITRDKWHPMSMLPVGGEPDT